MFPIRRVLFLMLSASSLFAQIEPQAGAWKTWVLSAGNQMRVPAPPSGGDSAAELQWLKDFMSSNSGSDAARSQIEYWDAGSPGYRWIKIASQEMINRNLPGALYARGMALVSVAMYDATVAAWDSKYAWKQPHPSQRDSSIVPLVAVPQSPSYPSEHAVAAGAAAAVLSYLFPESADSYTSLAREAGRSRMLAGVASPSDYAAGLQLGSAVGSAVVAWGQSDNSSAVFTGSYPPTPGKWSNPTPQTPLAGTWRPWVLSSASQLRPDAPPAADSPDFEAQVDQVRALTRNNTTNHSAWFWQPSFVTPWLDTLHREIFEWHLDTNPPRAARVYALATIAQYDATLACWDAKYVYLEPRPSMADPTITTLFANPPQPGYPSGHACASGGPAAVLDYLFPNDADALDAQAIDAGMSTFYAGIHTMFDVQQGLILGRAVGAKVVDKARQDGSQ